MTSTFGNRKTAIDPAPVALTPTFTESATADTQWRAFVRRGKFTEAPARLHDVATELAMFLLPVAAGCLAGSFAQTWKAPGPWRPRDRVFYFEEPPGFEPGNGGFAGLAPGP